MRHNTAARQIRHALAEALAIDPVYAEDMIKTASETVDVHGAAALLKTTPRAIYVRHQRGQMPEPVRGARRLVWRKEDLLKIG
jgi:hypothetical protein